MGKNKKEEELENIMLHIAARLVVDEYFQEIKKLEEAEAEETGELSD